jgi:hypothetical protein
MAIFVNGGQLRDRAGLPDAVDEEGTIDVDSGVVGGTAMSRVLTRHVATRKGLFTVTRGGSGWTVSRAGFLGDNCTLTMHDPRSGDLIAALHHGHFGAKLHRSRDEGASWQEIGAPAYPPMPEGYTPKMTHNDKPIDWALKLVWALAPGGAVSRQSGRVMGAAS